MKLNHENIVQLLKVFRKGDELYLVFEFWNQNLYELYKSSIEEMKESKIKKIIHQLLQGVGYIHKVQNSTLNSILKAKLHPPRLETREYFD
jgi:serine/threonine protein kinase